MKTVVVVPCFNEDKRFPMSYWIEITSATSFEWVFVDDGSTDSTSLLLARLNSKNVRTIILPSNKGKSEAIRYGAIWALRAFPSEIGILGYIDSDGAFALADILSIESTARSNQSFQMIWSSRVALSGNDIQRSLKRHYLGRFVSTLIWFGGRSAIYDTQSGLKFMTLPPLFESIFTEPFKTRWFVDLEILVRWHEIVETRPAVLEIPLSYWHEQPGSKVSMSHAFSILNEILFIRRQLKSMISYGP